jgi:hypothetical protein
MERVHVFADEAGNFEVERGDGPMIVDMSGLPDENSDG